MFIDREFNAPLDKIALVDHLIFTKIIIYFFYFSSLE